MMQPAVLYIEDDVDDVALLQYAWKRVGVQNPLRVARDGEEALRYLSGEGRYANRVDHPLPGVVLLDLRLPKVSGLEVLKWIRQQPTLHELRVIIVTSWLRPQDTVAAEALGIDAFLAKPTHFDEWRALVDTLSESWLGGG
jgi:CheY-like chemotaxis protein